ncbi:MAG TPA: hypothetical protein VFW48_05640 [Solirubrobacterales bacterium]|nr:hypothetical protein [Solirubrobacterales bacterium]
MSVKLIHRIPIAVVLAVLSAAILVPSATASTGFQAEEEDSTYSTKLIGEATSSFYLSLGGAAEAACPLSSPFSVKTNIPSTGALAPLPQSINCGGAGAQLQTNGCRVALAPEGTFGIGPVGCGPMILQHNGSTCSIPSQTGLSATYTNKGTGSSRTITVEGADAGLQYDCGLGQKENGIIQAGWSLSAKGVADQAEGLWVSNSLSLPRLCKSAGESCAAKDLYPAESALEASSAAAALALTFPGLGTVKINCESSFKGQIGLGAVSAWNLTGCKVGKGPTTCTATTESLPFAGSLAQGAGNAGALTVFNSGNGTPRWHIECGEWGEVSNCTYSFETKPVLDISSGAPATLVASNEVLTESGPECPGETPKFTATYTINTPSPLYVAKG